VVEVEEGVIMDTLTIAAAVGEEEEEAFTTSIIRMEEEEEVEEVIQSQALPVARLFVFYLLKAQLCHPP